VGKTLVSSISLRTALSKDCEKLEQAAPTNERFFSYKACYIGTRNGDTAVFVLEALAGVEYTLRVTGEPGVPLPLLEYPVEWGEQGQPVDMVPWFKFDQTSVAYTSIVAASPGSKAEVTFTIPDLFWRPGQAPKHPKDVQTSWVLDFSWLFYTAGSPDLGYGIGIGDPEDFATQPGSPPDKLTPEQKILTLAGRAVYTGLVTYNSPLGCEVYPQPVPPNGVHPQPGDSSISKAIMRAYQPDIGGYDYKHTGIPIVFAASTCRRDPPQDGIVLEVKVKIPLRGGSYIIIPVFSYDDSGNRFKALFMVTLRDPGGAMVGAAFTREGEGTFYGEDPSHSIIGPTQYAIPMAVKTGTPGVHTLSIVVRNEGGWNREEVIALYLSKIVVVPMDEVGDVCVYRLPSYSYPAYPWVIINAKRGEVRDYGKAVIAPVYKPEQAQSPYSQPEAYAVLSPQYMATWRALATFYTFPVNQFRFDARGTTLTSWRYKNELGGITIRGMVTSGDDRLGAVHVMVAVDIDGVIYPPVRIAAFHQKATNFMSKGYFFFVAAEYRYYDGDLRPDREVLIRLELPTVPAGHLILVPYVFDWDEPAVSLPSVSGYGATLEARYQLSTVGTLMVLRAQGGPVTVEFKLAVPAKTDDPRYRYASKYSFLAIGPVAVIENPNVYAHVRKGAVPYGIFVTDVEPLPGMDVYIRVYDEDGRLINKDDDRFQASGTFNARIGIDVFRGHLNFEWWTYPYRDMFVVVHNARCASPGQEGTVRNLAS